MPSHNPPITSLSFHQVRLLLDHGSDLSLKEPDGRSPLHFAAGDPPPLQPVYILTH